MDAAYIDYLEFTVRYNTFGQLHSITQRVQDVYQTTVEVKNHGMHGGYSKSASFLGGKAYMAWSDGKPEKGCKLSIPGSAIRLFQTKMEGDVDFHFFIKHTMEQFIMPHVKSIGGSHSKGYAIKRLDIAFDDTDSLRLDIAHMEMMTIERMFTSRAKSAYSIRGLYGNTDRHYGITVYYGSPQSDRLLRVYDKAAQMNVKSGHWVRTEMQVRNKPSHILFSLLYGFDSVAAITFCAGYFLDYIDFKTIKSPNMARVDTCTWWTEFLLSSPKATIMPYAEESDLHKRYKWVRRQVVPTLTALFLAHNILDGRSGGDTLIQSLLDEGQDRLSLADVGRIRQYVESLREDYNARNGSKP
jgi:hypothetical protein